MQDLYSSQIGVEAEIGYRRRLTVSLRSSQPAGRRPHPSLRAILAAYLAHLALHIDGRSLSTVAARHTHQPSITRYAGPA
jgi:hypothetical protein